MSYVRRLTLLTLLMTSSAPSTTFAQDVRQASPEVCRAHDLPAPCAIITVEALKLLNAQLVEETGKREAGDQALEGHKVIEQVRCSPDVTPFNWADLLKAGGVGVGVGMLLTVLVVTGGGR